MFGWLFTNLLCAAGVIRGFPYPYFGLMVYYAFAVLRPPFLWFWAWGFDPPRFSFYVAIPTLLGWAASGFGDSRNLRGVWLPIWGLIIYLSAGVFTAQYTAINSKWAWLSLDTQLKIGLMAWLTITIVRSTEQIRAFAYVVTASMGYLAWVFNSQYYFDKWNRVWVWGFGGIDNNGVAMIMVMGVPLAFFIGINDKRLWVRAGCAVSVLCMVHVVLFSFSRGGQLGLCMVGAVLFTVALISLPNKFLTIVSGLFVLCFAIYFAGAEVRERFWSIFADEQTRDASAASRFDTWKAAWECMKEHPWGVGPRNFNLISHYYGLTPGKSVHNLYLQTGADYGFVGLFGLMLFYLGTAWRTFWITYHPVARRLVWPRFYAQMVTVSLSGFLLCSTFIGMESVETGFIVCLVGLCTVGYVNRVADEETSKRPVEKREQSYEQIETDLVPGY